MKNVVRSSIFVPAPCRKVWEYFSDFSDASRQFIEVETTEVVDSSTRLVTFTNGDRVKEMLMEKLPEKKMKWIQETQKGFIFIKNVDVEISLVCRDNYSKIHFSLHYETRLGPIGWLVNLLWERKRLLGIIKANGKRIKNHVYYLR